LGTATKQRHAILRRKISHSKKTASIHLHHQDLDEYVGQKSEEEEAETPSITVEADMDDQHDDFMDHDPSL